MRATLKDVARASGCSFQAVSAILGARAHEFSVELRDRVVAAADQLGYRPSSSARSMRQGRTGCVALVRGTAPTLNTVSDQVLFGITSELESHDLHLALLTLDDATLTSDVELNKILRQWMADGLLIKYDTRIPARLSDVLARFKIPAIWINSRHDCDCVLPDDHGAGVRATRHLIALGHRRIAYADYAYNLSDPEEHYSASDRYAGYREAMREAQLEPALIAGDKQVPEDGRVGYSLAQLARPDRPTAIVCNSAWVAYPFWHAAMRLGLAVPADLSLFTFEVRRQNNLGPELSQLLVPDYEVGRTATAMLVDKLRDPEARHQPRAIPFKMIVGETCAPAREVYA
ncbi:MAG: LacI family DNA-binding transcriptional regulator [Planctomycetes bacterium]|nr:LacI family DNA-binding transcriptional regulator [Planctomycetota bacterium]